MPEIKLTKNELRAQQIKLRLLQRYLPTLQLKKALLQSEVHETKLQIERLRNLEEEAMDKVSSFASLFAATLNVDLISFVKVKSIQKRHENIAGSDVPVYEGVTFEPLNYDLFDTPPWLESAIHWLRKAATIDAQVQIEEERKRILEKELREVSIRVNLFEKVLIPRALLNIKKIKIFLGDALLTAVAQAKVAKVKIELAKAASHAD